MASEIARFDFVGTSKLVGGVLLESELPRIRPKQERVIVINVLQNRIVMTHRRSQCEPIRHNPKPIGDNDLILTVAKQKAVCAESLVAMLIHTRVAQIRAEPELVTHCRIEAQLRETIFESKNEL